MKKPNEIKSLNLKDLKSKAKELREELFWLKFKNKTGQMEKTSNIRDAKRNLARVLTFLKQQTTKNSAKAGE
jgi:large subunit ribosomal protein L29